MGNTKMERDALEPEKLSDTEKRISLLFIFGWRAKVNEPQLSIEGSSEKILVLESTTSQFRVGFWQS